MKFMFGDEIVFKGLLTSEKPTLAMLLANGNVVVDSDGTKYEESTYDNHRVIYGEPHNNEVIIYVQRA